MPAKSVDSASVKPVEHQEPEFSKLRSALWPIRRSEVKKFLPMGLMMFFVLFVYAVMRATKDAMITDSAGAEAISFLKSFGVLPVAVIFVVLYAKFSRKFSRQTLFYMIIGSFMMFFASFAFVIFPNVETLHPSKETIVGLQESMPFLKHFFGIYGAWTDSAFYISAELWGSVVLTLLFWQFANEITRTREAKRFYPMFALIGNFGYIFAGHLTEYYAKLGKNHPESWGTSLKYLMGMSVIACVATMVIYWWMNRRILTDPAQYDGATADPKAKKSKPKLSLKEGFRYVFTNRYIGLIALLVLCYGVSINLVEITWKSQVKKVYTDINDYEAFMGRFLAITGYVTIAFILLSKGVIRRFGWTKGALVTPIVLLVTGTLFYTFVIFNGKLTWLSTLMGVTPVVAAVIFGMVQNFLSKATKYSLFDPTKEMAYIPLDQELKVKGKAAVDVVGGRFGKSAGGYIQSGLLMAMPAATQLTLAPILAGVMIVMTLIWIFAAKRLGRLYNQTAQDAERAEMETAPSSDEKSGTAEPAKAAA